MPPSLLLRPRFPELFRLASPERGDSVPFGVPRYFEGLGAQVGPDSGVQASRGNSRPVVLAISRHWGDVFSGASSTQRSEILEVLAGVRLGEHAFATNYGGHQFGSWAGQLGDGRATIVGEALTTSGERLELQLKGAGRTPFSRRGDGRAVLRSSLREFLMSEAMHGLGVPTTRALSLIATGQGVLRDRFYDGRPREEPGAIVCRTAPTFLRFGHFELLAERGEIEELRALVAYTISEFYPSLADALSAATLDQTTAFVQAVSDRSAALVAQWQVLGFVHGVLNTDNMSILGLTVDYGPFGFMDEWDPAYTPNTSDLPGRRYCYARQPQICAWNVGMWAQALGTAWGLNAFHQGNLVDSPLVRVALDTFQSRFPIALRQAWAKRLGYDDGFSPDSPQGQSLAELQRLLALSRFDLNFVLREYAESLREGHPESFAAGLSLSADRMGYSHAKSQELLEDWKRWSSFDRELELPHAKDVRGKAMCATNPRFVLHNHGLARLIDAVEGWLESTVDEASSSLSGESWPEAQPQSLREILLALENPFQDSDQGKRWSEPLPQEERHLECRLNSCSS